MPTESGVDTTGNQSANIEDMFSDEKYQLEEGLNALNNRPLNPLEEVQQRLVQQYNQQQENPTGNVENVTPDKGEGMVESATVEAKQEVAIEKVAAEANQISPDFGNGVKAELQQTARESLRMKVEAKVYDLLTDIERKVGQGAVMQRIKSEMAWAKSSLAGASAEDKKDVALGRRNLKYGYESVTFVPGGEVPPSQRFFNGNVKVDKPTAEIRNNIFSGNPRTSDNLGLAFMTAEDSLKYNPVIGTLEKWRSTLRERQTSVNGAKQLVSNYGNVS